MQKEGNVATDPTIQEEGKESETNDNDNKKDSSELIASYSSEIGCFYLNKTDEGYVIIPETIIVQDDLISTLTGSSWSVTLHGRLTLKEFAYSDESAAGGGWHIKFDSDTAVKEHYSYDPSVSPESENCTYSIGDNLITIGDTSYTVLSKDEKTINTLEYNFPWEWTVCVFRLII